MSQTPCMEQGASDLSCTVHSQCCVWSTFLCHTLRIHACKRHSLCCHMQTINNCRVDHLTCSNRACRLPSRRGASANQIGRSQLQQSQAWSPFRPGPKPAGPHIAASLSVRGRRIIITAALVGAANGVEPQCCCAAACGASWSQLLLLHVHALVQFRTAVCSIA
jgi:hypothetical protein